MTYRIDSTVRDEMSRSLEWLPSKVARALAPAIYVLCMGGAIVGLVTVEILCFVGITAAALAFEWAFLPPLGGLDDGHSPVRLAVNVFLISSLALRFLFWLGKRIYQLLQIGIIWIEGIVCILVTVGMFTYYVRRLYF